MQQWSVGYVLSNAASAALDADVPVYPGDIVLAPNQGRRRYVLGDVNRPGGIAVVTNDSKLSALQPLSLAGGTRPNAVPSHSGLIRRQADGSYVERPMQLGPTQKGKEIGYSVAG